MSVNIPPLPPFQPQWADFQVWWELARTAIENEFGALETADDALAAALAAQAAAAAAAHTADWSGVTDDDGHKPDNDATLGANWTTNLTSRPTELTDGRVAAGLTSAGDLNRDITTTRANSSNLLRKTSGGLYTGDLNATLGADLATNVTNVVPKNLPAITGSGGRYKFTGAISYSVDGTGAAATISVGAGSLLIGNTTVSYNAMSANVSGSGTITYYLYVNTNMFTNGAHTLHTTTSGNTVYSDDDNVYIGTCTVVYSAGGTGGGLGGGGFGPACPWAEAFVHTARGWVKAFDVVEGDLVRTLEGWETVQRNTPSQGNCYTIHSRSGFELTVSDTTPITLRDGSSILADEINGHELPVDRNGVVWEPCFITDAGWLPVAHISCHGKTFSAGNEPERGILTHNTDKP